MQHVDVLKKLNFDLLTPSPGWGGGGCRGVCWQNNCYHVAGFVILFNLICNMTKKLNFDLLTPPGWGSAGKPGLGGGSGGLRAKYLLPRCIRDFNQGEGGRRRGSACKIFDTMLVHS